MIFIKRYSSLCLVLSFLFCGTLCAQSNIDSLSLGKSTQNDFARLVHLKRTVDSLKYSDVDRMLIYIKEYEVLENRNTYTFAKGISDNLYGYYHIRKGNYEEAYIALKKALNKADQYGNKNAKVSIYNDIGNLFHMKKEFYRAYDYHKLAFKESVETGDTLFHGMYNMGLDLYEQKKYKEAIVDFLEMKSLIVNHNKTDDFYRHLLGDTEGILTVCYRELGDLENAESSIKSAVEVLSGKHKFLGSLSDVYVTYGHLMYQKGFTEKAGVLYKKAAEMVNDREYIFERYYFPNHLALGNYYFKEHLYYKAIEQANKALVSTQTRYKVSALELLYKVNDKLGNAKKTYEYGALFVEAKDRLFKEEQDNRIEDLLYKNNIIQLEDNNKLLAAETLASEHEVRTRKYIVLSVLAVSFLMLAIVLFFFFYNMYKEQLNNRLNLKVREHTSALEYMNLKLGNTNKELESFVFVTSQDLRVPIQRIGDTIKGIKEERNHLFEAKATIYFKFIQDGVAQMEQLISDVLDFAQFSGEKMDVDAVNLNELIADSLKPIKVVLKERNAIVLYDTLPTIYSNEAQLRMLLKNLIENGTKYNKSPQPEINISYDTVDGMHCISVKDNGIGIAAEDQDKVFGMFQRLNKDKNVQGTGLGLAICKDVVEAFGGDIKIESEIGKGTKFLIFLPMLNEAATILAE